MDAIEVTDARDVMVQRLSPGDREQVVNDFVWGRLGPDCSDAEFDALAVGCTVLYKDDLETGRSWYQVVDAQGHGDGCGAWLPVEG